MSHIEVPSPSARPRSNRPREAFTGFIALAAVIAAVIMSAVGILAKDAGEPIILVILAVLAMTGVFFMFATAAGLVRFAEEQNSQNLLEAWCEADNEGLHLVSPDGWVAYSSSAFSRLLGADDVTDGRWLDRALLHSSGGLEAAYRLAQAAATRQAWIENVELDKGAGQLRIAVSHLVAPDGEPLIAWRVTDRSAASFNSDADPADAAAGTILDSLPCAALLIRPDAKVRLNVMLASRLGRDGAAAQMSELNQILTRGSATALADCLSTLQTGDTATLELDFITSASQPQRLALQLSGANAAGDAFALIAANGRSMAAAGHNLEQSLARFFEAAPIAIAAVDRHGGIGRANAAFVRMFGEATAELTGSGLLGIVSADSREAVKLAFAAAAGGGDVAARTPIEFKFGKDGVRDGRLYISADAEPAGPAESFVLYAIDTTEQKELEAQFAQAQKMQAVGVLAGGIAHDFRNALMIIIIGFSDLLLANHRPNDPSYADIMAIKQNANRTANMVHQLLAFSRQQTLRPAVLSLTEVLSNFKSTFARVLGEQYKLKVEPGIDLWPVKADATQLDHVIMNLAVNARDAMPKGGHLTITARNAIAAEVEASPDKGLVPGDYVLMEVSDTGSGMPPEVLAKIFLPFFTTKDIGKGTGLGLSMVYGIVKQTGGYIYCDSTPGAGTAFRIYLPRYTGQLSVPAAPKPSGKDMSKVKDMTGTGTVLVVEDEEEVRRFAKRALERQGFTVIGCGSGREALEAMAAQTKAGKKIDIVVSDIVMPEMDGPTLLREIRKTHPDLRIIFMSGYAEGALESLDDATEYSFLSKPVHMKDLVEAVKQGLSRS